MFTICLQFIHHLLLAWCYNVYIVKKENKVSHETIARRNKHMNELVTQAVKDINTIKESMIESGNSIARIIYGIRDELKERNTCRDFGVAVGMSKASISKMVTAETFRAKLDIIDAVSYNAIYKVKDLLDAGGITAMNTTYLLNQLKSEKEIRNTLCEPEDATTLNDNDLTYCEEDSTEDTRSEIMSQIFDILGNYDIAKDDMKLIKMLMKGLR